MIGMKDGTIKMLYDPLISIRGACLVEGRTVLNSYSILIVQNVKKKEMTFGRLDAIAYAPEGNNDDIRDNRDDPKKRDNRPGFLDPYLIFIYIR